MKHSNVKGNDKITYTLFKQAVSPLFRLFLLNFFNSIILSYKVPESLNISIIKPIIKNQLKPTDDINNIRPLSVSNCIALSTLFSKSTLR